MAQSTVKLEMIKFHRILLAHTHTAENYAYSLSSCEIGTREGDYIYGGVLEIGFVESNPLCFQDKDGEIHVAKEGDVFIIPPMSKFDVYARNKKPHKHVTTETIIDCRTGENATGNAVLELPMIIPGGAHTEKIITAIRRTANKRTPQGRDHFRQYSDFMRILEALEAYTITAESNASPSHERYCRAAEQYIIDNISKKLQVEEIAEAVGISKNYLTNIFSATRKMPLVEYINRLKLDHMIELMLRFNCPVRVAGEYVGLDNVNYISRMFRKYYGVTISEYKRSLL